jgi:hypothetical protein
MRLRQIEEPWLGCVFWRFKRINVGIQHELHSAEDF